jgi:hypothetical protein
MRHDNLSDHHRHVRRSVGGAVRDGVDSASIGARSFAAQQERAIVGSKITL